MVRRSILLLVLAFVLFAGCTGPAETTPEAPEDDPVLHTRPGGFDATSDASRFHLHDYWSGKDRLVLMEETRGTSVTSLGQDVLREQFRPPAGSVVPLGTANVSVALSWTLEPGAQHGDVWLYVKTQADNVSEPFMVVENGEPVVFQTTNAQNDLPHQLLSAWSFDLYLTPDSQTNVLRFNGQVEIVVIVERGLEIPLFPPHPDHWDGKAELVLFDDSAQAGHIDHWPAPNSICTGGCLPIHVPTDGAIVPLGAETVRVVLSIGDQSQGGVRLAYHRADARAWTEVEPTGGDGAEQVYDLPVEGAVDGPYSASSLWEFQVVTQKTQDNGWFQGSYTIHAVALRGAE